jgi:hypothetical protein
MSLLTLPLSVLRFTVNAHTVVITVYRLRAMFEEDRFKHIARSR